MAAKKKSSSKKSNTTGLLIAVLVMMLVVMTASLLNIYKLRQSVSNDGQIVESDVISNEFKNKFYTIGNNATEINKEYFKSLNDSVESGDKTAIAEDVVKCFVSEYYTWTNKDGNYDVGGMQYIYPDRQSDFAAYTRDNFYSSMDNYLHGNKRSSLIEIQDVAITGSEEGTADVMNADGAPVNYPCINVSATWTFVPGSVMNTGTIQSGATFTVIDHDGRMEIAAIQ